MRLGSFTGLLTVFIAVHIEETYAVLSCCQKSRQDLKKMKETIEETLTNKVSTLTNDVSTLKKAMSSLTNTVSTIKSELSNLRTDINRDISGLTRDIAALLKILNACGSMPCQNNCVCTGEINSYSCKCKAGYTGSNCETDIDECDSDPCQNNGTCTDQLNSYKCECKAGYTGINCEMDINECDSDPCQNSGTCTDQVNSYKCSCKTGYTGKNCETDIDECYSGPCQNNGSCIDQENSYTCKCSAGYAGVNCQPVTLGNLKSKPIVEKRQLQSRMRDLAITSSGNIVATGATSTSTKIYDSNYSLIKDIGQLFWFVALTSDDKLVFTDVTSTIYFYTAEGIPIRNIAVKGSPSQLYGITVLSTGQLVVCDGNTDRVYRVDPFTGDSTPISKSGTFTWPFYVTTNSKGVIIVSDVHGHSIKGLDQAGKVLFSYGTFGAPVGVCTDTKDYIVVADQHNHRIELLTPVGRFERYLLTQNDTVYQPRAVSINHSGQLLVGVRYGQLFTITYRKQVKTLM